MRAEHLRKGDSVPYTQIANELLNFKNLSFKAKGIYAYLYSKPTDWDFAANRIALDGLDGREAILSGLKELIDAGYLTRRKMPDGRMEYEIWVHPKS
jgi:hypothetical protein